MTAYTAPEEWRLRTIGQIDWSDGRYQFDLTVVWQREVDGVFMYAEDSGCSCPSPFEDLTPAGLIEIASIGEFLRHLQERNATGFDGPRDAQIARLLELMQAARTDRAVSGA